VHSSEQSQARTDSLQKYAGIFLKEFLPARHAPKKWPFIDTAQLITMTEALARICAAASAHLKKGVAGKLAVARTPLAQDRVPNWESGLIRTRNGASLLK
jgi:hypothetical protein